MSTQPKFTTQPYIKYGVLLTWPLPDGAVVELVKPIDDGPRDPVGGIVRMAGKKEKRPVGRLPRLTFAA